MNDEYKDKYIKGIYEEITLKIRKDDSLVLKKLENCENVNKYILDLIREDINKNRIYNYINNEVVIDFELSNPMQNLVNLAEEADYIDDYGWYMNLADAIDEQGKKEATHHIISDAQWHKSNE